MSCKAGFVLTISLFGQQETMFYREHLRALDMDRMNFDLYKKNSGNNHLDNYWGKFENFGATKFSER